MTSEWQQKLIPNPEQTPVPIYIADQKLLEAIVGFRLHQGVMAVARVPDDGMIADCLRDQTRGLVVALDGITSAENVGVIVRNCSAFGVDAVITGNTSASAYLRRAVRNSMGTVFKMRTYHASSLPETLIELKTFYGFTICAAHPAGNIALSDAQFAKKTVVVFGSEGEGTSDEVLNLADELISIPMRNGTDSINVAAASAVFLYEIKRQTKTESAS